MAVGLSEPGELFPIAGIRIATTHCGIKSDPDIKDLTLVEISSGATVVGVFTQSHFSAAPVRICQQHLADNIDSRYLLINSGNANAATGSDGLAAAGRCCDALAALTDVTRQQVLPFSTGVIAEPLPFKKITEALPHLVSALQSDAWLNGARAIMTTDTIPKAFSLQIDVDGSAVTITGMAKGSGMIKPDMATMLSFIATDAKISRDHLQKMIVDQVADSFNSITVDGDTSTNDSCILIATGASGIEIGTEHEAFATALQTVFGFLAKAIIRDAEGATKFIEVSVEAAASVADARSIAFTIAESPLVKTALFASDPNWGRFIMAIGRSPVEKIDIDKVDLYLGEVRLLFNGLPDPDYQESLGQAQMSKQEITLRVNLNLGQARARIWTSDLSYEYVKINAEYRS